MGIPALQELREVPPRARGCAAPRARPICAFQGSPARARMCLGDTLGRFGESRFPRAREDVSGAIVPLLVSWAVLGRIGLGFILPSLNIGAMRDLGHTHIPQGSSVINFLRMLGGAAGVSLCGIVLEWRISAYGFRLDTASTNPARLTAFNETFLMLAAVCALALVAAWRLREPPGPGA